MKLEDLWRNAKNAYMNHDLHEALDCYLEIEKKYKASSELLIEIALIYDELEEFQTALSYYYKALEIDAMNAVCYYGLGTVYDTLKDYDKAIAFYKEAISLDEKYYQAHFFLACIYDDREENSLAIHHYQKTIELNPEYFYAYLNLGALYESMNKNELSLEYLLKAESITTDNHLLYFNFGVVYKKLGYTDLSIESYKKSLKISNQYPYTYLNLAILYKDEKHDLMKAIEIYSQGIKHHEKAVLYYNRACSFALIQKENEAMKDLMKAIELDYYLYDYMLEDEELTILLTNESNQKLLRNKLNTSK